MMRRRRSMRQSKVGGAVATMNELHWVMVLSLALGGAAAWAQAGSNAPPGSSRVTTTPAPLPLPLAPDSGPAVQRPRAPAVVAPAAPAAPRVAVPTPAQPAQPAAPARAAAVEAAPVAPALAAHGLPAARQGNEVAAPPAKSAGRAGQSAVGKSAAAKSAHSGRPTKPAEGTVAEDRRLVREPPLRPDPPAPKLATAAKEAEPAKGRGHQRTVKAVVRHAQEAKAAPSARTGKSAKASPTNKGSPGAKAGKPGKGAVAHGNAPRARGAPTKALPNRRRNDGSQP